MCYIPTCVQFCSLDYHEMTIFIIMFTEGNKNQKQQLMIYKAIVIV